MSHVIESTRSRFLALMAECEDASLRTSAHHLYEALTLSQPLDDEYAAAGVKWGHECATALVNGYSCVMAWAMYQALAQVYERERAFAIWEGATAIVLPLMPWFDLEYATRIQPEIDRWMPSAWDQKPHTDAPPFPMFEFMMSLSGAGYCRQPKDLMFGTEFAIFVALHPLEFMAGLREVLRAFESTQIGDWPPFDTASLRVEDVLAELLKIGRAVESRSATVLERVLRTHAEAILNSIIIATTPEVIEQSERQESARTEAALREAVSAAKVCRTVRSRGILASMAAMLFNSNNSVGNQESQRGVIEATLRKRIPDRAEAAANMAVTRYRAVSEALERAWRELSSEHDQLGRRAAPSAPWRESRIDNSESLLKEWKAWFRHSFVEVLESTIPTDILRWEVALGSTSDD
jgi:hypothetical protein